MLIKEVIQAVANGKDISSPTSKKVMENIMDGLCSDAQIASLITALRIKGESVDEIYGFALGMREKALKISINNMDLVDACGTGGDARNTFNISTVSSFVAAGAGVKIAKHGNRAVSSKCGSADLIEGLGISINIAPKNIKKCLDETGMVFLFAPVYHNAMKNAANARKDVGMRTIFNLLGPLANPLGAKKQLLGCYDPVMTKKLASVLKRLGSKHAIVVHGAGGLDEISISGSSEISEMVNGGIRSYKFDPKKFGIPAASIGSLKCASAKESANMTMRVLKGLKGAPRNIVLLNTAFIILAADLEKKFKDAYILAQESIDSGSALNVIKKLRNISHDLS